MKKSIYIILLLFTPLLIYAQGISMGGGTATGTNSFGYGTNTTASGEASIAGGIDSEATHTATIAIGANAKSYADYGISIGDNTYVDALGGVSIGAYCYALADHSLSIGLNNVITSNAYYSTTLGAGNRAEAYGSLALGVDNKAKGTFSAALGTKNIALSYGELALGTFADTTGYSGFNPNYWVADDRLLVLGNGYKDGPTINRSNALVILKSGDASFQGGLTIGSLETAIDADEDTKLVVYGGTILSETEELEEQVLIGTNVRNNEAKLIVQNAGYPHALKIKGRRSSSGTAVVVEGNTRLEGNLTITGSVAKGSGTFKIDHPLDPENKYLYHSFVESPEMMNVYNGNVTTDAEGKALVLLPDYFEALNMDFRYQLTPIGQFAQVIIAEEVTKNQFKIKSDIPNVKVSWQVTGVRNDAYAQSNRVKVSVEKPENEKGTYMHPAAIATLKNKTLKNPSHAQK